MSKEKLKKWLDTYGIEGISYCNGCNSYTVIIDGNYYSAHEDNFFKFFPLIDRKIFEEHKEDVLSSTCYCCNRCVNHWGLDLCACGSGEPYEECNEGYDVCGKPMQSIKEKYICVKGSGAWL